MTVTCFRTLLFFCLAALLAPAARADSKAKDSLYDVTTARKLDPSKLSLFGPQAGKFRYDNRMVHAAQIAAARAHRHSTSFCWRYVKDALVAAHIISTRPVTAYAKEAGAELTQSFGFRRVREKNPYKAPIGSVIVYGGRGAGHVELRTAQGFVSDFASERPSPRPLVGIFVKPRA